MKKELSIEDQPATKGDVAALGEHFGNLLAGSEKTIRGEMRDMRTELKGEIQGLRGDMEQGNSRLEEKIDKLIDAVQENTHHIKLMFPKVLGRQAKV